MSKVSCPCGNQMSDVAVPSSDKLWLITDEAMGALGDDYGLTTEMILEKSSDVWHCAKCGRMAVGSDGPSRTLVWYVKENIDAKGPL